MNKTPRPPFDSCLTTREIVGGIVLIPFFGLGLPLLVTVAAVYFSWITPGTAMVLTNGISFLLVLLIFFRWLREQYDIMCDRMGTVIWNIIGGMAMIYLLSFVVSYLIAWLGSTDVAAANINSGAVTVLAGQDLRYTKAMSIFIVPVVEETLFRGVVYGGLWKRSRTLAAAVSILLFILYHIWSYLAAGVPDTWIYGLQYLPIAVALCIAYERSGSIWTCIFIHMINSALTYSLAV